jgi:hypothetical protein
MRPSRAGGYLAGTGATGTTAQDWLTEAEAEYAAQRAERIRRAGEFAADLAKDVNDRLADLGIVPFTPASGDASGYVVAALLVPAAIDEALYGVHATFDEDEGQVALRVSD